MASSRPPATTRRTRAAPDPQQGAEAEISTARWAGVALVVAALLGAVTLAVITPSDGGSPSDGGLDSRLGAVSATVAPSAPTDDRVPTEPPDIVQPGEALTTGEWEIPVVVTVPSDPLPRKILTLEILRDGATLSQLARPKAGDVTVEGVRLLEGTNVITAALRGPGGLGPLSEPITVVLDRTVAPLTVTSPENRQTTTDNSVVVSGTSEPGASVSIKNASRGWEDPAVVGPSGAFEMTVPLVEGKNRIVVISTDEAGNTRRANRVVTRQDGRPKLKLTAPKKVRLSALPTTVKLQVAASDAKGRPVKGADVVFAASIPGQSSETNEEQTDEDGRVVWRLPIPKGSSRGDTILVSIVVTAPNGASRDGLVQISVV